MTLDQRADRSHSYQGQDLFVLEVLGGMRGGFFLDSGASNGISGSNTRLFERSFSWRGICIEPNDASFLELVRNRSCICLNCCLYHREGPVDFLEAAGVYGGILNEYEPRHFRFARQMLADRWPKSVATPIVRKEARTLRTVLRETRAPSVIDYWSLDTEGSELNILRSFPFDEYRFRVLTVEHNGSGVREDIRQFLEGQAYTRVRVLGIDDAYVWNGELPSQSRSAVWGLARRSHG
jgi:methyltransferase FkbM-like protein